MVATKTGSTWSLTPSKDGVSVDPTSGVITVAHNAASAGTQVSATAKHGNSDASTASTANLPAKETTPNAPTVASDGMLLKRPILVENGTVKQIGYRKAYEELGLK